GLPGGRLAQPLPGRHRRRRAPGLTAPHRRRQDQAGDVTVPRRRFTSPEGFVTPDPRRSETRLVHDVLTYLLTEFDPRSQPPLERSLDELLRETVRDAGGDLVDGPPAALARRADDTAVVSAGFPRARGAAGTAGRGGPP